MAFVSGRVFRGGSPTQFHTYFFSLPHMLYAFPLSSERVDAQEGKT